MKLLDLFRKQPASAPAARERLQILLAHERAGREGGADFLPQLQRELLQVVKKYVQIDDDKVQVQLDRQGDVATLEVNVELPETVPEQKRSA
ncbi:cell division topological specificity factor MinE [Rhodovibrio sodomensis]|uniref:Cell division topological specificity factor n=1 Tax=Rhodovibrio sodomensis TaxID=1088 RepID=A0ABS1DFS5_9PROT|nr:cell division topological specificity factor MinE [Rhodovibrio sodomensis]MBK1668734.1 cell division topological specificity factor MinE [Rhodovibrio sodomensis]